MTAKLIVLYDTPSDVKSFFKHYVEVHTPLVRQMPGLQQLVLNRATSDPQGNPAPYFAIAEMDFRDGAALQAAMQSPITAKIVEDVMAFTQGKIKVLFAETLEIDQLETMQV